MKSITHENRRRFTILTIVSVLVVAILTTTLVLLLKKDTTAPTNTIEVGKRIDTSLGGGRKLLNASVWDGSSSTAPSGSGTSADPYLIESAANLAYWKDNYSDFVYKQISIQVDIDLNGYAWSGIEQYGDSLKGNDHYIYNINLVSSKRYAAIGFIIESYAASICNLNLVFCEGKVNAEHQYVGGLVAMHTDGTNIVYCSVENLHLYSNGATYTYGLSCILGPSINSDTGRVTNINSSQAINCSIDIVDLNTTLDFKCGIMACTTDWLRNCVTSDCFVSVTTTSSLEVPTFCLGGVASACTLLMSNIISDTDLTFSASLTADIVEIGGIVGEYSCTSASYQCYYNGDITGTFNASGGSTYGTTLYLGGLIGKFAANSADLSEGFFDGTINISSERIYCGGISGFLLGTSITNSLAQGAISITTSNSYSFIGGLTGYESNVSLTKCIAIVNLSMTNKGKVGSIAGSISTSATNTYLFGNKDLVTGSSIVSTSFDYSTTKLKSFSTYSSVLDFDTIWFYHENLNDGYPILNWASGYAQVTGFEGSGTEADPYQIKTTADLQGMQAYYNDYDMIDEYWWKLMNDIDISVDANDLAINWCPIGYEGGVASGFNGHLDGNGKTISGLTITAQYENVGLFGRLSSDATITNLNVSGTIAWDQAKYVGGVVGLMEDGATLTNCSFTGTITGYLNSGNHAVVGGLAGKYSADAITGIANYDCYVYGTDNYTTFNRFNSTYAVA